MHDCLSECFSFFIAVIIDVLTAGDTTRVHIRRSRQGIAPSRCGPAKTGATASPKMEPDASLAFVSTDSITFDLALPVLSLLLNHRLAVYGDLHRLT